MSHPPRSATLHNTRYQPISFPIEAYAAILKQIPWFGGIAQGLLVAFAAIALKRAVAVAAAQVKTICGDRCHSGSKNNGSGLSRRSSHHHGSLALFPCLE
jgi:hypothetical protein